MDHECGQPHQRRCARCPVPPLWRTAINDGMGLGGNDAPHHPDRDESSRRPGSSGTLVNGVQVKVIDTETGSPCGVREPGELYVRNRLARFKGYMDNEVANRAFTSDGRFQTGDYGYLDEGSNMCIVDRIKKLIKVGKGYGSHVSATEIEGVVFGHPAVGSVVVVGCRNEAAQRDRPTAFVVLKPEFRKKPQEAKKDIEPICGRGTDWLAKSVWRGPLY